MSIVAAQPTCCLDISYNRCVRARVHVCVSNKSVLSVSASVVQHTKMSFIHSCDMCAQFVTGEEGQDAGGLLREWYIIISREIFNPMYALFATSPGDRVTYTINPLSHCNSNHLSYFKFVGRIIAKAVYDNKLLECYFTRSFYKHILGVLVK